MSVKQIHIAGYRSVRDLDLRLSAVNVLTGPNGCGKSNLYHSLVLVARAAQGQLARAVADEGGMPSLLWAGREIRTRRKTPKRVTLSFDTEDLGYELTLGPVPTQPGDPTMFALDPDVKDEAIWPAATPHRSLLMERKARSAWVRNDGGRMKVYPLALEPSESIIAQIREPHLYPELSQLRTEILSWRFYHHFRTDSRSPLRQPQIGVRTPVLSGDASDLAAALQSIIEMGDSEGLETAVSEGFGGAKLFIESDRTLFSIKVEMPGVRRRFDARELSDGQLRFLCLCAALLSPRPPRLLGLNEPETSLHPALVSPLARLVVRASQHTQLWITTHSELLTAAISSKTGTAPIRLRLRPDGTRIDYA
jgi:predicted ATPase